MPVVDLHRSRFATTRCHNASMPHDEGDAVEDSNTHDHASVRNPAVLTTRNLIKSKSTLQDNNTHDATSLVAVDEIAGKNTSIGCDHWCAICKIYAGNYSSLQAGKRRMTGNWFTIRENPAIVNCFEHEWLCGEEGISALRITRNWFTSKEGTCRNLKQCVRSSCSPARTIP